MISSGRGPSLASSFDVGRASAVKTIAAVIGRNARPVSIGREALGLLQEVRQEQEDGEHRDAGDPDGQVRAAAGAVGDDAQRQQRVRDARLDPRRTPTAGRRRRPSMMIVTGWPQEFVSEFEKP